ncbi:MAG: ISNCY family transposase [Acidobacteria bacterium]|nr:ISNCY family transposase [Acidobacteriota bacterium]MBX3289105.1 ISNCY family transposase [Acidobacteriota bacterium]
MTRLYRKAAVERAMKRQEIILRAYAKKISWIEAAEILGYSARHLRRLREKYEEYGFEGLFDGRMGKVSPRRIAVEVVEEVLRLYREQYYDFNVRHFHEKLEEEHSMTISYTWVRNLLQESGLVAKKRPRKKHRKRRERKAVRGMMLHIDGSEHRWLAGDGRRYDLIVVMDDATSEIYYAQLVDEESTATCMAAIREVIEKQGVFCTLYSDRGSHFWTTPKAGEPVDKQALTQFGRALRELGIRMIAAYSPQARGRSERSFRTWQGRLPQELRLKGITTVEEANRFLKQSYIGEFNRRFTVSASEPEVSAFVPCTRDDLDRVFSIHTERTVNRDNTVSYKGMILQIEKQSWRGSMEGCQVTVHRHLDDTISIGFGPHEIGRFAPDGQTLKKQKMKIAKEKAEKVKKAVEMPLMRKCGKSKNDFPHSLNRLEKSQSRLSHIPTASAAI